MTRRASQGKKRTELTRLRDISGVPKLTPRAVKVSVKRIIRNTFGSQLDPKLDPLAREAARMFLRELGELPSYSAGVQSSVAAFVRQYMAAQFYCAKALEVGRDTDQGMKYMEASKAHDQAAERHKLAALDRAVHDAKMARATEQARQQDSLHSIVTSSETIEPTSDD